MNVFEKNINALMSKNAKLVNKIINFVPTEMPQLIQENGNFNLKYKNILLHNKQNPLGEAVEVFSGAENHPTAIHLIYGLGLGYLFQVASLRSQGTVILYEPDLAILKTAFMFVDFSADIKKTNIFISDDIEEVSGYIYQKSNVKNSPLLLITEEYRKLAGDEFNELVANLQRIVGMYSLDLKYTQEKFFPLSCAVIENIPCLINEIPLTKIKDFYKGKTAVVVSAGPTLDRNIETIKKYRDNIVLFVVGTAMKTLSAKGIIPDFLCVIESYDSSRQLEGVDTSKVNFITEPFSNRNMRKFNFKHVFSHISSNLPVNKLWSDIIDEDRSEYLSKGTVSYTALNSARILGCSRIILVGQDLAYIEGQCYSKDSAYKELECRFNQDANKWEISAKNFEDFANSISNAPSFEERRDAANRRLNNLNASLYYVKGIRGDNIPTESVYAAFINPLSEFTSIYSDREYINTSMVGAQIDGFKNMTLEEALSGTVPIDKRELDIDYNIDVEKIKTSLNALSKELDLILNGFEQPRKIIKNINNDINRYKSLNQDILKNLKHLSSLYAELSSSQKDTIFDFVSAAERINVEYEMRSMTNFTVENVKNITNTLNNYYNQAEEKSNVIIQKIQQVLGEI